MDEFLLLRRVPPDQAAYARQQADEAEHAPQHSAGRWHVANQRLMRPVVGVGDCEPGRSVLAAHEVHQKNAASCCCLAGLVSAPCGMAYSDRPLANTSA